MCQQCVHSDIMLIFPNSLYCRPVRVPTYKPSLMRQLQWRMFNMLRSIGWRVYSVQERDKPNSFNLLSVPELMHARLPIKVQQGLNSKQVHIMFSGKLQILPQRPYNMLIMRFKLLFIHKLLCNKMHSILHITRHSHPKFHLPLNQHLHQLRQSGHQLFGMLL